MPGDTRKVDKKGKGMTIPQLRRAFEDIQEFVKKTKYSLPEFRKHWEKVFGKSVSLKAAKEYLEYLKEHHANPKQHGGMAPLDYQLRPGVDGVYGNFPPYVSSGFGPTLRDSFTMGCGKEDISPRVPASMGSNLFSAKGGGKKYKKHQTRRKQRGGALISPTLSNIVAEALNRPVLSSSPPGMLYPFSHHR